MILLFKTLYQRNALLSIFAAANLAAAAVCIILLFTSHTQVLGINAWIKPFKFFISTTIFSFSIAWITWHLKQPIKTTIYSWVIVLVLTFENVYISLQASKGALSHFNISTAHASLMFSLMGVAITILTVWTGYIAFLFFKKKDMALSPSYLWGIRWGMVCFVIFAFQGGVMAASLQHTVGAPDGGPGWPLTNWSTRHGDLRIAHFLGMHALQLLPLAGFYVAKSKRQIHFISLVYFVVTSLIFLQAMMGKPLI